MRTGKTYGIIALFGLLALACGRASAQESSINTFSPYTFYGIGNLSTPGPAYLRSMGGAGIGFRSTIMTNTLNPASYGANGRKSFIFNFGMEGQNFYEKTDRTKTSYNTFNIRDVSVQFPLYKGLGFAFSMTPYSKVGYRVKKVDTRPDIVADPGYVEYLYEGSGGITQFKAGIGWAFSHRWSVGAELVYYHGSIDRNATMRAYNITGTGTIQGTRIYKDEDISRFLGSFGIQYSPVMNSRGAFTIGLTYRMGGRLDSEVSRYIPANGFEGDTVFYRNYTSDLSLPHEIGAGIYLHRAKFSFGVDYVYSMWGTANGGVYDDGRIAYRNTHTVKAGVQYIPNPGDVRHFLNRWSYRLGFRYQTYYMDVNGRHIDDKAVTLGVGVPLKMLGVNNINVGIEAGQRGNTRRGMIRERYFKFFLEFSLFGEDYWFVKQKYD